MSRSKSPRIGCRTVVVALAVLALAVPAGAEEAVYALPAHPNEWTSPAIDVLVFPPAHGQVVNDQGPLGGHGTAELTPANSYLEAIESSIAAWKNGIATFGAAWLRDGLRIEVFVVGRDSVPPDVIADPEVLLVSGESEVAFAGSAADVEFPGCCFERIVDLCVVDNSRLLVDDDEARAFSLTEADMYNLNAQEFGHCLGADHVFDEPRHDPQATPYADRWGSAGTHRHCVSNLDIRAVELAFGHLFGRPSGGVATMPASEYRQIGC